MSLSKKPFALVPSAKPANSNVEGPMGSFMAGDRAMIDARRHSEYMAGLQQKLTLLDSTPSHGVEAISGNPLWAGHNGKGFAASCSIYTARSPRTPRCDHLQGFDVQAGRENPFMRPQYCKDK